jgi:hypothetical protein
LLLAGEGRGIGPNQLSAHEVQELRAELRAHRFLRKLCNRALPEDLPDDGRTFEHGSLFAIEAIEAGSQKGLDRRRHCDAG